MLGRSTCTQVCNEDLAMGTNSVESLLQFSPCQACPSTGKLI